MLIFASYQISVNSFWLVLRPRLFSLLSFSLIGVSILVGGSWIGEVSPCIASTAKRTRLEDNREQCEKHKTLTQLQHFKIRFLPLIHTTIVQLKTTYLDIISALRKLGFETQPRCCGGKVFNYSCGVHLSRFIRNYILKIKHFLIKYRRILSSPMA